MDILSVFIFFTSLVYNGPKASFDFTQTGEGGKGEVPCQVIFVLPGVGLSKMK